MTLTSFFSIALGAILIENFVLVRILGICPFLGVSKRTDMALGMGLAVIFVMGTASAVTWLIDQLLIALDLSYMRTLAFILAIAALVQLVEIFLKKVSPALNQALGIYLPLITTNCAVLGVAILNSDYQYSFLESVWFGVTAAIGFTLALLLFATLRDRIAYSDYPKAFEGFPIALVTASLLAMAFMGFSGLQVF